MAGRRAATALWRPPVYWMVSFCKGLPRLMCAYAFITCWSGKKVDRKLDEAQ